jgi:hypothetical protein
MGGARDMRERPARARRISVTAAAVVAMAVAVVPSAAAAADTTPPSVPRETYYHWDFQCTGVHFAWWRPSTDNVDSRAELRYRFYDAEGRLLRMGEQSEFQSDPGTDGRHTNGTWVGFLTAPRTVRAVDRAGNLSAPAVLQHGLPPT